MTSEIREIYLSVSDLNQLARLALEKGLQSCRVQGEVSNFTRAGSGHWYFTLKDEKASVRCVMFKIRNQFVDWSPRDGDHVELRAQPTLYEQRGDFQLLVDAMRQTGLGSLFEAFLRLKAKLEVEGLFAPERKQPIPRIPHTIGVITSPQAAALRDVLSTIKARWPACDIILYPTQVQGEAAPASLIEAMHEAGARRECDVLLLVRGGGSLEDMMGFNDEAVARAISACPIPIISGIGHETDFTIADFVADLRAPTPTGAAQAAAPSRQDILKQVQNLNTRLNQAHLRKLHVLNQRLDGLSRRVTHPRERIAGRQQQLRHAMLRLSVSARSRIRTDAVRYERCKTSLPAMLTQPLRDEFTRRRDRLQVSMKNGLTVHTSALQIHQARLELLNPDAVLARGYSIATNAHGHVVRDARDIVVDQPVLITLARGRIEALAKKIVPER